MVAFHYIDMSTYARRAHFAYFKSLPYPYVGITADVDVTAALAYARANSCSFYLTFLHVAALAADSVPALRQRIRGDEIVEYDACPTSHIELLADTSYCYCTLHHHMPMRDYLVQAGRARAACRENGIEEDADVESMLFISTLPWVHYTSLIQPVAGGDESNPRITWGRYDVGADGRAVMPVSILAHHALVDGIHIAQFYSNLDAEQQKL